MRISILPPEMKGVIVPSGYRGKGKTLFASQADLPENIAFFDFEDKAEGLHAQLHFGYYKSISQQENTPLSRGDLFLREIANLPEDKFTVAIIDNILPLEKSLQALVYRDARKYADIYGYSIPDIMKDSYGKARGITNDLIGDAICKPLYAKGIQLVIATSHAKATYNVPGKMTIYGRDRWQDLSILTLILIDGDHHPIPSAIVQKEQLASISSLDNLTNEQIQAIMRGELASHIITRRLPYRLPKCDWQSIRYYLHHPANLKEPGSGEALNLEEAEPFSERLSKEQIAYQLRALEVEQRAEQEMSSLELLLSQEKVTAIKKYLAETLNGQPVPVKINQLKKAIELGELAYDGEITPGKIIEWSK
jgi:hypothetical protein